MATKSTSSQNKPTAALQFMEEEFLCSICSELFINAVTLNCSHSFCMFCIKEWQKQKLICPICRKDITSITKTLVVDNFIAKVLEKQTKEVKDYRKELVTQRNALETKHKQSENNPIPNRVLILPNIGYYHGNAAPILISESDSEDDYNVVEDEGHYHEEEGEVEGEEDQDGYNTEEAPEFNEENEDVEDNFNPQWERQSSDEEDGQWAPKSDTENDENLPEYESDGEANDQQWPSEHTEQYTDDVIHWHPNDNENEEYSEYNNDNNEDDNNTGQHWEPEYPNEEGEINDGQDDNNWEDINQEAYDGDNEGNYDNYLECYDPYEYY